MVLCIHKHINIHFDGERTANGICVFVFVFVCELGMNIESVVVAVHL